MPTTADVTTKVLAAPLVPAATGGCEDGASSTLTVANIDAQQLSSNRWQLRDRRQPGDDPRGLLGFIERVRRSSTTDTVFEVMTLSDGFEFFTFATLQEAVTHVAQYASEATGEHQRNDLAWIFCSTSAM